mmetsp:Transcript_1821/g.6195  ORF Transcript_1821/g.6195 Transcript_1821/m.6195 type:complete len:250 (+) Transcript_1821:8275-9024(+)
MGCVTFLCKGRSLVMNACNSSGTLPTSNPRNALSKSPRPSSSTAAPIDHTRENRKRHSSQVCTVVLLNSATKPTLGVSNSASKALKRRMQLCARLISCIGCGILHVFVAMRAKGGTNQSKFPSMIDFISLVIPCGRVLSQLIITGRQPSKLGWTYTMPHRDTVAGDATARSATSKIMFIKPCMAIISPEFRHSFLLSSSTVFMFSIQIASTGPSNTTHFLSRVVSATAFLIKVDPSPSHHSFVIWLYSP